VEEKAKLQWNQTSALIAAIYNNATYNTRLWKPDDFNPLAERRQQRARPKTMSLHSLAKMFHVPGVPAKAPTNPQSPIPNP
jgi:hypothetical protein